MGAIALTGTAGFTACSQDDALTDATPSISGETVKTQFTISVPNAGTAGTRLTDDIVQSDGQASSFRGISNIRLVPFKNLDPSSVPTTTSLSGVTPITLDAIGTSGMQTPVQKNYNYKVYYDVPVDLGVNYFLFYGDATVTSGSYKENGSTVPSFDENGWPATTLDDVKFGLRARLDNSTGLENEQNILAAILTDIAATKTKVEQTDHAWSDETDNDLEKYYTAFTSLKAGSAASIKAAVADLYASMKSTGGTDNNGLKAAICTTIEKYFTPGTASSTTAYVSYPDFAYKTDEVTVNIDEDEEEETVTLPTTFPADFNLPDGSMKLKFANGTFSYDTGSMISTTESSLSTIAYDEYAYPASLYYTVATPIKVADATKTENGVYQNIGSYDSWSALVNGLYAGDDNNTVTATTQSIALINPVNYAVASLKLFARFMGDQAINDNDNPDYTDEGAKPVTIPTSGFELTGILIGDQKRVDYAFHRPADDAEATTWTIYDDSHVQGTAVKQSTSQPATPTAYTLALETLGNTEGNYENVYFALELVNESGQAFKGADGWVPAGGKFYLVGKMTANTEHTKVFEQDHTTIANVTITSLKNAYNCIPDLRSPQLELGLSVDLKWEEGLTQDVVIE